MTLKISMCVMCKRFGPIWVKNDRERFEKKCQPPIFPISGQPYTLLVTIITYIPATPRSYGQRALGLLSSDWQYDSISIPKQSADWVNIRLVSDFNNSRQATRTQKQRNSRGLEWAQMKGARRFHRVQGGGTASLEAFELHSVR